MTKDLVKTETSEISPEVKEFHKKNAEAGSGNISAQLPQLKVTEANSKNEGLDGQHLPEGSFYYAPTQADFKTVEVSILTISRGFWAMNNQEKPEPKFNQLVGGMMLESLEPFVMFMGGTRLQNLWDFGKEIKPFTKSKDNPFAMLGFRVMLSLKKIETNYGKNHIINFDLIRDKKGQIQVLNDAELLNMLRGGVDKNEELFESFINQKEVDRTTGQPIAETLAKTAREVFTPNPPTPVDDGEPR